MGYDLEGPSTMKGRKAPFIPQHLAEGEEGGSYYFYFEDDGLLNFVDDQYSGDVFDKFVYTYRKNIELSLSREFCEQELAAIDKSHLPQLEKMRPPNKVRLTDQECTISRKCDAEMGAYIEENKARLYDPSDYVND